MKCHIFFIFLECLEYQSRQGYAIIIIYFFSHLVLSMSEQEEVMGQLKVSMEAATALTGIYQEYFRREGDDSEEL